MTDNFVGAIVERETDGKFDANQYSFFDFEAPSGVALDDALEDGLQAPPEEEKLWEGDECTLSQDDLSLLSAFKNQLHADDGLTPLPDGTEADRICQQVENAMLPLRRPSHGLASVGMASTVGRMQRDVHLPPQPFPGTAQSLLDIEQRLLAGAGTTGHDGQAFVTPDITFSFIPTVSQGLELAFHQHAAPRIEVAPPADQAAWRTPPPPLYSRPPQPALAAFSYSVQPPPRVTGVVTAEALEARLLQQSEAAVAYPPASYPFPAARYQPNLVPGLHRPALTPSAHEVHAVIPGGIPSVDGQRTYGAYGPPHSYVPTQHTPVLPTQHAPALHMNDHLGFASQAGPAPPLHLDVPGKQSPAGLWPYPAPSIGGGSDGHQQHLSPPPRPAGYAPLLKTSGPPEAQVLITSTAAPYDAANIRPASYQYGANASRQAAEVPGRGSTQQSGSNARLKYRAKYMTPEEIDQIMRIHYAATHSGHPYVEDYYYQALASRTSKGYSAPFAPPSLRGYGRDESEQQNVSVAALSGLGKFVYHNLRTPKLLMDLNDNSATVPATASAEAAVGETHKPLEQEPLLAARMMIEDCLDIMLDIDDIDRLLSSTGPRLQSYPVAYLHQRRQMLLQTVVASFQLIATPAVDSLVVVNANTVGDGVFVRIIALPKGRVAVARILRLVTFTPDKTAGVDLPPHPVTVSDKSMMLWGVLRNIMHLFGGSDRMDQHMIVATVKLASATCQAIQSIDLPQELCNCMTALLDGFGRSASLDVQHVLPIGPPAQAGSTDVDWLGTILTCVIIKAGNLGMGMEPSPHDSTSDWQQLLERFSVIMLRHCSALLSAKAVGGNMPHLQSSAPSLLIQSIMPWAPTAQREQLQSDLLLQA